jgi:hypothetical protein
MGWILIAFVPVIKDANWAFAGFWVAERWPHLAGPLAPAVNETIFSLSVTVTFFSQGSWFTPFALPSAAISQ